jgi:hypothetical protein
MYADVKEMPRELKKNKSYFQFMYADVKEMPLNYINKLK